MKTIKHNKVKILSFLTAVVLLISIMIPTVAAKEVSWTLSEDDQTLSDGTNTYTYYATITYLDLETKKVHSYNDTVDHSTDGDCTVCANPDVSGVVWLEGWDVIYLYATEEGRQKLDSWFVDRTIGGYRVWTDLGSAALERELLNGMNDAAEGPNAMMRTVMVSELAELELYEIYAHDESELFVKICGAVYRWDDGSYYYLDYTTLDNSHFDANGNFSYRNGTVTLTLLDEELSARFAETVANVSDEFIPEYSWDPVDWGIIPQVIFWIFYVLVGLVAPLPFFVLGIVLANIRRIGRPKYWYVMSAFSLLWGIVALILGIWLIIC